jgi:hypothetical protein
VESLGLPRHRIFNTDLAVQFMSEEITGRKKHHFLRFPLLQIFMKNQIVSHKEAKKKLFKQRQYVPLTAT